MWYEPSFAAVTKDLCVCVCVCVCVWAVHIQSSALLLIKTVVVREGKLRDVCVCVCGSLWKSARCFVNTQHFLQRSEAVCDLCLSLLQFFMLLMS